MDKRTFNVENYYSISLRKSLNKTKKAMSFLRSLSSRKRGVGISSSLFVFLSFPKLQDVKCEANLTVPSLATLLEKFINCPFSIFLSPYSTRWDSCGQRGIKKPGSRNSQAERANFISKSFTAPVQQPISMHSEACPVREI